MKTIAALSTLLATALAAIPSGSFTLESDQSSPSYLPASYKTSSLPAAIEFTEITDTTLTFSGTYDSSDGHVVSGSNELYLAPTSISGRYQLMIGVPTTTDVSAFDIEESGGSYELVPSGLTGFWVSSCEANNAEDVFFESQHTGLCEGTLSAIKVVFDESS